MLKDIARHHVNVAMLKRTHDRINRRVCSKGMALVNRHYDQAQDFCEKTQRQCQNTCRRTGDNYRVTEVMVKALMLGIKF